MDIHELITELVARSYGQEAAGAYRAYQTTPEDLQLLAQHATRVLAAFANEPGACVLLCACCAAAFLEARRAPLYVVTGSLLIGETPIFGDGQPFDGDVLFSQSNMDWDGHAWIVLGKKMVDISLMRTAHSQHSPPALTQHINEQLGGQRTPILCDMSDPLGFTYVPQYVLSDEQITGFVRGAVARALGKLPGSA